MAIRGQASRILGELDDEDVESQQEETEKERLKRLKLQNKAYLDSRQQLLLEVRKRPELVEKLGLVDKPSNAQILRLFKQMEDPLTTLRDAGLEPDEAMKIADHIFGALHAVPPEPLFKCLRKPGGKLFVLCGLLFLASAMLFLASYLLVASYEDGWRHGECNILAYSQKICSVGSCKFDIEIREVQTEAKGLTTFAFTDWAMPMEPDVFNPPDIRIAGDAFRCCNRNRDLNCCNMYDPKAFLFCDNSPHLDDPDGNPCPAGDWRCLFKVNVTNGIEQPIEVVTYLPPDVLPFWIAGGAVGLFAIMAGSLGFCRRTQCWGLERRIADFVGVYMPKMPAKKGSVADFGRNKKNKVEQPEDYFEKETNRSTLLESPTTNAQDADFNYSEEVSTDCGYDSPNPNDAEQRRSYGSGLEDGPPQPPDVVPQPPDVVMPQEPDDRPPALQPLPVEKPQEELKYKKDKYPAFAKGSLAAYAASPVAMAAAVPLIAPLPPAVAARRSREVRRQKNRARPASAPAGMRDLEACDVRKPAWTKEEMFFQEAVGQAHQTRSRRLSKKSEAVTRSTSATSRRLPSAMSRRPESSTTRWSESATSTWPEHNSGSRPESAPIPPKRPMSGPAIRSEIGLSRLKHTERVRPASAAMF